MSVFICPQCNGTDIEYDFVTIENDEGGTDYYDAMKCNRCGYEWQEED